jgi:hypothetical protein
MNLSTLQSAPHPDVFIYRDLLMARSALASRQAPRFHVPFMNSTPPAYRSSSWPILAAERSSYLPSSGGLDLLRAVSLRVPDSVPPSAAIASSNPQKSSDPPSLAKFENNRYYVDRIRDLDILCGRGGKSNHHPGNKKYRQVVSEMKNTYRSTEARKSKTDLSRAIVDMVCEYGGRFVRKDEPSGRYYVLSKAEARKKTSQALRETKILKWTN